MSERKRSYQEIIEDVRLGKEIFDMNIDEENGYVCFCINDDVIYYLCLRYRRPFLYGPKNGCRGIHNFIGAFSTIEDADVFCRDDFPKHMQMLFKGEYIERF